MQCRQRLNVKVFCEVYFGYLALTMDDETPLFNTAPISIEVIEKT